MKQLLLLALASLSTSAYAYYEDDKDVQAFVAAGQPTIELNSKRCPARYFNDEKATDQLGADRFHLCVRHVAPPQAVLAELKQMANDQLENHSDYDQRITKVYLFETTRAKSDSVSNYVLDNLKKALNIPAAMTESLSIQSGVVTEKDLSRFGGLTVGDEWQDNWSEESETYKFLKKELVGKKAIHLTFENEKGLYPGGGINVRFHVFFFDGKIVYVKHVGWDA